LFFDFAAQIPKGDVDGGDCKRCDAAAADIVNMPLHAVIEGIDILAVLADEEGPQILSDHREHGFPTTPAGIGVASTFLTGFETDGCGDQFEMGVVPMFGVAQHFGERNAKQASINGFDLRHGLSKEFLGLEACS